MLKRIIESQVVEYLGKPSQNVLCLNKYENTTIPIEGGSIMPLSRPEQNPPWLPYLPFPVQMLVTMSTSYGLNYANHEKSAKTKRRGEKAKTGMAKWQKFGDRTTPQRLNVPDIIVDAEDEPAQSNLRSGGKFNMLQWQPQTNNYQSEIHIFRFKRVPEVPLCLPHPTPPGQDQSHQVPGQEQSQDQDLGPSSPEGDLCSRRRPREMLRIFSMKLWRF